jgi:hypothetical protein
MRDKIAQRNFLVRNKQVTPMLLRYFVFFQQFFFFQYPGDLYQQAISNFIDIAMATTELFIPAGNN